VTTPAPEAERRFVSVLFADLVGFTTLSESRDPEEVRELLSRYFDTSRQLITRYGGTVEKFIGDAVMAVWGTPVAREDDAERSVRAALDLTEAVTALGEEVGAPDLRARAGVLTGEAAVTLGAEGERMVKELFHASAEDRKAHLVSVVGIAGIGKSRLAWEFYKYFDGLTQLYAWHRGRCLAYGEGVAHWALAEMVRMRARIVEGEDQA